MARREVTGRKPALTAAEAERSFGSPSPPAVKPPDPSIELVTKAEPAAIEPTAVSEPSVPAKAKTPRARGPPVAVPAAWYSLEEFAAAHRLSMAMLFKLKSEGRGPRETEVGSRRFVTFEDAAEWRATQQKPPRSAKEGSREHR
jgi:hypothetical protein